MTIETMKDATTQTTATTEPAQTQAPAATNEKENLLGDNATVETKQIEGEAKTLEEKPEDKEKNQGAPEKYTDFSLPEGLTIDAERTAEFSTVAKELNLTQDQAQKLVDLQSKLALESQSKALLDYEKTVNDWAAESKKVLGHDYKEKLALSAKAIDSLLPPEDAKELREFFKLSGLGNHPQLNKLFYSLGKSMSEDSFVTSGASGGEKSAAEIMYGNK